MLTEFQLFSLSVAEVIEKQNRAGLYISVANSKTLVKLVNLRLYLHVIYEWDFQTYS